MTFITIDSVHKSPQCNPLDSSDEELDLDEAVESIIRKLGATHLSTAALRRGARAIQDLKIEAAVASPSQALRIQRVAFAKSDTTTPMIEVHPYSQRLECGGFARVLYEEKESHWSRTTDLFEILRQPNLAISDFRMCRKSISEPSSCQPIQLPKPMRRNIVRFLETHPDDRTWNCVDFANAAAGYTRPPHTRYIHDWEIRPFNPTTLVPGTIIAMKDKNKYLHFAIYLANDLYLSKHGELPLIVSSLHEMQECYHGDQIEILVPRSQAK